MENVTGPALTPDELHARLRVLEAAVAALARFALPKEDLAGFLAIIEDSEKFLFGLGVPAGSLPLGKLMLDLKEVAPKRAAG